MDHRKDMAVKFESSGCITAVSSFTIPHTRNLGPLHLLAQLIDSIHESLSRRWAARHVDVNRDDPVYSPHH